MGQNKSYAVFRGNFIRMVHSSSRFNVEEKYQILCMCLDEDDGGNIDVLVGATVGAGIGLIIIILLVTAICCACFR